MFKLDDLVNIDSLADLFTLFTVFTLAILVYFERMYSFLSFAFSIVVAKLAV